MAIKTTSIRDIFKKKVSSDVEETILNSYEAPTIWIDSETGEEHEDFDYPELDCEIPGKPTRTTWYPLSGEEATIFVNGPIKQIGSHVTKCTGLFPRFMQGSSGSSPADYPFMDNIRDVFKYARNLESLNSTFYNFGTESYTFMIPENLFWNCPKLKSLYNVFYRAHIAEIPANLLSKCPDLENVKSLFCSATIDTEEIPDGLFKNNPKIKNFDIAFYNSNVSKVSNTLLSQFKDDIDRGIVSVHDFLKSTWAARHFRIE